MFGLEYLFGKLFGSGESKASPAPNAKGWFVGFGLNAVDPAQYGGWDGKLVACHNDVKALKSALATGPRWTAEIILDKDATSKRAASTFRQLADLVEPGDLVVIAASGHGGQILDVTGDEPDRKDETWVLWDMEVPDDVVNTWLSWFRPGVRVLLIRDTCHSATIARAAFSADAAQRLRPKSVPVQFREAAAIAQEDRLYILRDAYKPAIIQANVLTLAACKDSEVAYDGDQHGRFTGALLRSLQTNPASYEAWLKDAQKLCRPLQTPQLVQDGPIKPTKALAKQKPFTL